MTILGPIFRWEMIVTARKGRSFVIRGIYGLCLLLFLCLPLFMAWGLTNRTAMTHEDLAGIAEGFFVSTVAAQGLAVFVLTPALVAGALAEERARGTLNLLLGSALSSSEIVLGKLAARMSHLVIILLVAVPVIGLLSLMGGIDLPLLAVCDGVTLSTSLLIAAASIGISAVSHRPHRAIAGAYLFEVGWLVW